MPEQRHSREHTWRDRQEAPARLAVADRAPRRGGAAAAPAPVPRTGGAGFLAAAVERAARWSAHAALREAPLRPSPRRVARRQVRAVADAGSRRGLRRPGAGGRPLTRRGPDGVAPLRCVGGQRRRKATRQYVTAPCASELGVAADEGLPGASDYARSSWRTDAEWPSASACASLWRLGRERPCDLARAGPSRAANYSTVRQALGRGNEDAATAHRQRRAAPACHLLASSLAARRWRRTSPRCDGLAGGALLDRRSTLAARSRPAIERRGGRLPDPNVHEAFDRLKEQGKARFMGFSSAHAAPGAGGVAAIESGRFDAMMLAYHHGAWPQLGDLDLARAPRARHGRGGDEDAEGRQAPRPGGLQEQATRSQAALSGCSPTRRLVPGDLVPRVPARRRVPARLGQAPERRGPGAARRVRPPDRGHLRAPHCDAASPPRPAPDVRRGRQLGERGHPRYAAGKNASVCASCSAPCLGASLGLHVQDRMTGAHRILPFLATPDARAALAPLGCVPRARRRGVAWAGAARGLVRARGRPARLAARRGRAPGAVPARRHARARRERDAAQLPARELWNHRDKLLLRGHAARDRAVLPRLLAAGVLTARRPPAPSRRASARERRARGARGGASLPARDASPPTIRRRGCAGPGTSSTAGRARGFRGALPHLRHGRPRRARRALRGRDLQAPDRASAPTARRATTSAPGARATTGSRAGSSSMPFAAREYAWRQYRDVEHLTSRRAHRRPARLPAAGAARAAHEAAASRALLPAELLRRRGAAAAARGRAAAGIERRRGGVAAAGGDAGARWRHDHAQAQRLRGPRAAPLLYELAGARHPGRAGADQRGDAVVSRRRSDRNFGPWGLSFASDRWDLRRALVLEAPLEKATGATRGRAPCCYVDLQTLQPLYYISWDKSGELIDVGHVRRAAGARTAPDYPRWPDDPGARRARDRSGRRRVRQRARPGRLAARDLGHRLDRRPTTRRGASACMLGGGA